MGIDLYQPAPCGQICGLSQFLVDLLALQRAISWFEEEQTPAERDRFVEEVTSAVLSR